MSIEKVPVWASQAKPATKTTTYVLLIAAVPAGMALLFFLPVIFNYLSITGEAATTITQSVVDRWLQLLAALATVFGVTRGGVSWIKTLAPYVIKYLMEKGEQLANQPKAPVAVVPISGTAPFTTPIGAPQPEPLEFENAPLDNAVDDELEELRERAEAIARRKGVDVVAGILGDLR